MLLYLYYLYSNIIIITGHVDVLFVEEMPLPRALTPAVQWHLSPHSVLSLVLSSIGGMAPTVVSISMPLEGGGSGIRYRF